MAGLRRLLPTSENSLRRLLTPHALIDDEVINEYFRIIERRSWYHRHSLPSVHAFDSFFLPDWRERRYSNIDRRTKGVNVFDKEMLIFPIHLPQRGSRGHWALIVVDVVTSTVTSYDSCGWNHEEVLAEVKEYLEYEARRHRVTKEVIWILRNTPRDIPLQSNDYDCGVYVCIYGEIIARRSCLAGRTMCGRQMRKRVATALRAGRIGLENFELWEPSRRANLLSPEVRCLPPKGASQPGPPISVQLQDGTYPDIVAYWDPMLIQLEADADEGYKPEAGDVKFQPVRTDLTEGMFGGDNPRKVETRDDPIETYPHSEVSIVEMIDAAMEDFATPVLDTLQDVNDGIPMDTDEVRMQEEVKVPSPRSTSPCLSLAASDSWELIETGPRENQEAEKTSARETSRPHHSTSSLKKKKRHPKRVKIYDESGSFRRVNVNQLG